MEASDKRLKPCPFCGCEIIQLGVYHGTNQYGFPYSEIKIYCPRCMVVMHDVCDASLTKTKNRIIKAWNRRIINGGT